MEKHSMVRNIFRKMLPVLIVLMITLALSVTAFAASAYEVTKSGGALVRVSYAEKYDSVYRAPEGSILWVQASKVNSSGNTWYQLTDGYWIFSGNVKPHTCTGTWVSGYNPTCTANGVHNYRCNKCGNSWSMTTGAYGHNYDGHACTRCGVWDGKGIWSSSSVSNVRYYVTTNGAKVHAGPFGATKTVATLNRGSQITVTRKLVNSSLNTWYQYNGGYIFEDYVVEHNSCKWGTATVTKAATCTATGIKTQKCTICGAGKSISIAKTSHNYKDHVCTGCGTWKSSSLISTKALSNEKYYVKTDGAKVHSGPYGATGTVRTLSKGTNITVTQKIVNASLNTWYKCSDGGYIFGDYVVEHNSCKWNSGTVTKAATCTATGTKTYKCTICGMAKTSTIAKVKHKYDGHVCKTCGAWDTSSLISKSTINNLKYYVKTTGAKVHSGPYAGARTVKTLSKGTNVVVTQKVVNASLNTWYKCSDGYIFKDYVVEHNSCKWNSGTVTKKATCTVNGTKTYKCTVCGKTKTASITKTGHKYDGHVCKTCGAWDTASLKSKTTLQNVKYIVLTEGAKVHSGPYAKCKTVKKLAKGTIITVTQKVTNASKNVWYKYSDGYIYGDYVKDYALYTAKTTLNATSATLYVQQTKTLTATVKGPSSTVTWKSSDTSVATVSSSGKVTAKKAGTCTITATANGKKATCKITVKQLAAPTGVTYTGSARSFKVSHKAVSGADGYEVTYNPLSSAKSKAYTGTSATVTIDASADCDFKIYVRAYKLIGDKKYYGKASTITKVHIHNAPKNTSTQYSVKDYTYHTAAYKFMCQDCGKYFTQKKNIKHTFTCGVCQTCGKKQGSDYAVARFYPNEGKGPSYSSSSAKNGKNPISVAVKFNDKLFTGNSSTFNKDLCKISAVGAAATYDAGLAKEFLQSCGFSKDNIEAKNSSSSASTSKQGNNHHARYIMGHKKIAGTNTTLVAVLINGYTSGRYEWISNFTVGNSGLHEGFSTAADEVYAKVNSYISSKGINTSNIKIWVTGHSRAGAITGMVSVKLNKIYGAQNVFAYGFATPNGVPTVMDRNADDSNIFNIVNKGDFVPYVVPESWNFTKYGTTYTLSPSSTAKTYYKTMTKDSYSGLSSTDRSKLINAFCDLASNRTDYNTTKKVTLPTGLSDPMTGLPKFKTYTSKPSDFGRVIGLSMSKAGLNSEAAKLLANCLACDFLDSGNVLVQMVEKGKLTSEINEAHCMDTYVAMVFDKYK